MDNLLYSPPLELRDRICSVALSTNQTESELISAALKCYLAEYEAQIALIKEGIKKADSGDFASDAEVAAVFNKWRPNGR